MILKLSCRNIFRQKKRTALTLITVIVAICFAVIGDGLNSGLKWQLKNVYIHTETSSLKIYRKDFKPKDEDINPLEHPFLNFDEIDKLVSSTAWIKASSARISFTGSAVSSGLELPCRFLGIDGERENAVFNRKNDLVSGQFLDPADSTSVVIGMELAALLSVKTGDFVTIIARTSLKAINAYDCRICGIIRTGNPMIDSSQIFLSRGFASDFVQSGPTEIAVLADTQDDFRLFPLTDKLNASFSSHDARADSWLVELADLFSLIRMREKIFAIIVGFILIMAAAGIANTMLMAMLERKREIGILMAGGMSRREILSLFLSEGTFIGLLGSLIGMCLGAAIVHYYQIHGIRVPADITKVGGDFPVRDMFYPYLNWSMALFYFLIGSGVAMLSSLYPAWRALQLDPVEAIKG
ncbi:MAG: FtsX-like permease family protein [Candidatus Wallbacteria bacterium]|nr:FtsX-like permease family protein [Candidatus Wallbacteria bacterium]